MCVLDDVVVVDVKSEEAVCTKNTKVGGGGCARGGGISALLVTCYHRSASAGTDQLAALRPTQERAVEPRAPHARHTTSHSQPLLSSIFILPQPHEQH